MLKFVKFAVVAAVLACAAPVLAQTPAERLGDAIDLINNRFGPQAEFRAPPPASDPEVAKSLADIEASMEVFATPAFPIDGLSTFASVCVPLSQLPVRYVTAGMNSVFPDSKPPTTPQEYYALMNKPEALSLMARNAIRHQDVATLFMVTSVKCMSLHMPVVEKFWQDLPPSERTAVRIQGLKQLRSGAAGMVRGAVLNATDPSMSTKNRNLLTVAAATYLPAMARTLPVSERKVLLAEVLKADPAFKRTYPKEFEIITQTLSSTECTDVCLVP
ncbi:hypothetical protein [Asticcacaulis sp. AC460]|uniref:hypothetical protein n=1 Tax=Asticcacaulis sp. AC460 TaxID=1282360 RepID=UPI0012DEDB42|nr:hypothetical protein [Asticcacaulis sp. AC460]